MPKLMEGANDLGKPPTHERCYSKTNLADSHADALASYQPLREANRALRCNFVEGRDKVGGVELPDAVAVGAECRGEHRWVASERVELGSQIR